MNAAVVFSLPALGAFVMLGWAVDRVLGAGFARAGMVRWPLRFMTGLAVTFLLALHPLAAVVVLAPAAIVRLRRGRDVGSPRTLDPPRTERVVLAAFAVLAGVAAFRAATPLYWDEFVWLAKSRIEQGGWGTLRAAALDPGAAVFPPGYPLLWSLAPAWLTAPWHRAPLTVGTWWMQIAATALWLWSLREALGSSPRSDSAIPRSVAFGAFLLGMTPLLVVHLRASYADLPVGLLVATLALLHVRAMSSHAVLPQVLAARVVVAIILVGLKDEGFVHLLAVTLTGTILALVARRARAACESAVVLAVGTIPLATWRILLATHGVIDVDHRMSTCALGEAPGLVRALLLHATDVISWGFLWPVVIVAMALSLARYRQDDGPARNLAAVLGSMLVLTVSALTCGPERVREFAFGGSLLNRVLVQFAPLAIGLVTVLAARAIQATHAE